MTAEQISSRGGQVFSLKPLRLWSRPIILLFVCASVFLAVVSRRMLLREDGGGSRFILLVAVVAAAFVVGAAILRARRSSLCIRLLPDRLVLPQRLGLASGFELPYREMTKLVLQDHRNPAYLLFGGPRGDFVFALKAFSEPQAAYALHNEVRERVRAFLPRGEDRIRVFDEQSKMAATQEVHSLRGAAIVFWALMVVYLLQFFGSAFDGPEDGLPLLLVRLGANSLELVRDGQWFRLVSANFLHANYFHLGLNALGILTLGIAIERLLGTTAFFAVYLFSGLTGAAASAFLGPAELSVGASTAVFGLLGAFAWINLRHRTQTPPRFRPSGHWWLLVVVLSGVLAMAFPLVTDNMAHLGGFVGGLLVCILLVPSRVQLPLVKTPAWTALFARLLGAVTVVGLLCAVVHYIKDPAGDREKVFTNLVASKDTHPLLLNNIAWVLATRPDTTPDGLHMAKEAAEKALTRTVDAKERPTVSDTLATVMYRLGKFDRAIDLEMDALHSRDDRFLASQLARFLLARVEAKGTLVFEEDYPGTLHLRLTRQGPKRSPTLSVELSQPLNHSLVVHAVAVFEEKSVGLLRAQIPPTPAGVHLLEAPNKVLSRQWPDGTELVVGVVKRGDDDWKSWPMDKTALSLP